MKPNRPTPEGRLIGKELARLTDQAEPGVLAKFPDHARRCNSCAFTANTLPNGCLPTVMDALKCVMEGEIFYCHQPKPGPDGRPTTPCAGWMMALDAVGNKKPIPTPWPYSFDGEKA
jgi:hypothetical protein